MSRVSMFAAAAAVATLLSAPPSVFADNNAVQESCGVRTKGPYGFQCHGWAAVSAVGLEPVTFLGTVAGSKAGRFTGTGTFNSSLGSARQRVDGLAQFSDRSCGGRISYEVWLLAPNGSDLLRLPNLDIDFVTVDNGREVLGSPYSPAGVGPAVPRMVCRLVKSGGSD